MIIANDLPYQAEQADLRGFRDAIRDVLAFSARDWAEERDTAYIYAIVFGWGSPDDPETDAWDEIAAKHGWDPALVADLKRLHSEFDTGDDHE